jgi:hypothetical protein
MRSMVEGAILLAQHCWESPLHHAATRRGPPPRAGEELMTAHHLQAMLNTCQDNLKLIAARLLSDMKADGKSSRCVQGVGTSEKGWGLGIE